MPCQFPGCPFPTPSNQAWCIHHGKVYADKPAQKKQQELSLPDLLTKAQKVFNAFIRDRDRAFGCFTCSSSGTEAGHFIPVGENSALRFEEENCHLQCSVCNGLKGGNRKIYRAVMVQKYGEGRVKELETAPRFNKWTREQLENIIEKYSTVTSS